MRRSSFYNVFWRCHHFSRHNMRTEMGIISRRCNLIGPMIRSRSLCSDRQSRSKTQFRLFEKMFLQYSGLIQRYRGTRDPSVPELSELLKAADVEPDLKTYNLLISKLMADGDHMKARQATMLRKAHSSLGENSNLNSKEKTSSSNSDQSSMSTTKVNQEISLFENMFLKWSKFMHSSHSEGTEIFSHDNTSLQNKDSNKELRRDNKRNRISSDSDTSKIIKRNRHRSRSQDLNQGRTQSRDQSKNHDKKVKMTKKTKRVVFGNTNQHARSA